jgi:diguanylate cyclase (GGDEF)-like protein
MGDRIPRVGDEDDEIEGTKTKIHAAVQPSAQDRRARPHLVILAGGNIGEMVPLDGPETIIGRASDATLRIEDGGVSRRHVTLTTTAGEVHVEDLKSANGTFVNGEPLTSVRVLREGDKISLGSTVVLKFTMGDDVDVTFQRKMLDAAYRDGLTGAFNKKYLLHRLQAELAFARRHKTTVSLVMLDVDHFKRINDTYGHAMGDEVLVKLTATAQATMRKEDVFARYGGEEFCVVCRSIDVASTAVFAERLRANVAAMKIEHRGSRVPVTSSFGIAGFPEVAAQTPEALIAAADEALYEAKRGGRNRVVCKKPRSR